MSGNTRKEIIESVSESSTINLDETLKAFGLTSLNEANMASLKQINDALSTAFKSYGYQNGYNIYRYLKSIKESQRGFCIMPADGKMIIFPPFAKKNDLGKEDYFAWIQQQIISCKITIPDASSVESEASSEGEEKAEETAPTTLTLAEIISKYQAQIAACTVDDKAIINKKNILNCWEITHSETLPDELKANARRYLINTLTHKNIFWHVRQHGDKYQFHFRFGQGTNIHQLPHLINYDHLLVWLPDLSSCKNYLINLLESLNWTPHQALAAELLSANDDDLTKLFQENRDMANSMINTTESTDILTAFFERIPSYCFNPKVVAAQLHKWDVETRPISADELPHFIERLNASDYQTLKTKVAADTWTAEYEALIPKLAIPQLSEAEQKAMKKKKKKKRAPAALPPLEKRLLNLQQAIADSNLKGVKTTLNTLSSEELLTLDTQYPLINKAILQWHYTYFKTSNFEDQLIKTTKTQLNKHKKLTCPPENAALRKSRQDLEVTLETIQAMLPELRRHSPAEKEQQIQILNQLIDRGCSTEAPIHKTIATMILYPIVNRIQTLAADKALIAVVRLANHFMSVYSAVNEHHRQSLDELEATPFELENMSIMPEHLLGFLGRTDLIETLFQQGLDPSRFFEIHLEVSDGPKVKATAFDCLRSRVAITELDKLSKYYPGKTSFQALNYLVMPDRRYLKNPAVKDNPTFKNHMRYSDIHEPIQAVKRSFEAFERPEAFLKIPNDTNLGTELIDTVTGSSTQFRARPLLWALDYIKTLGRIKLKKILKTERWPRGTDGNLIIPDEDLAIMDEQREKEDAYFAEVVVPLLMDHGASPLVEDHMKDSNISMIKTCCLAHCETLRFEKSIQAIISRLDTTNTDIREKLKELGFEVTFVQTQALPFLGSLSTETPTGFGTEECAGAGAGTESM